jgi:NAD(P)-dependent dehydrogenase (short-subunit alcohol dehydrogenase family)
MNSIQARPPAAQAERRVAIVTGAASGLGFALSAELVSRGVFVVLADRDVEGGETAARELNGSGAGCEFVLVDVTSFEEVDLLVAGVFARHGRLDLMFNNAGRGVLGEVRDMESHHWQDMIDVNLGGVAAGVQACWRRMAEQGFGHVVNTSSLAGLVPTATGTAYSAVKHAVVALSLALREEGRGLGLRCTVACPGFVRTGFGSSAEYLGVEREALFAPGAQDHELTRSFARRILNGVEANRAVVITPAWLRLVWWAGRLLPSLLTRLVGTVALRRHRAVRLGASVGSSTRPGAPR